MKKSEIKIPADGVTLAGDLVIPEDASSVIIFAHGSGSSRFSTRNRYIAGTLQEAGFATLLMDLLTKSEETADSVTGHLRFDIGLLARRLIAGTRYVMDDKRTENFKIGYFGASTGAAAALAAAAELPVAISAVVSRGGRPDLAGEALERVKAPTLLIVGGDDRPVIGMNRDAMKHIHAEKELIIVPGATHLFEEPGALEEVARYAAGWFEKYLKPR